MIRDGIWGHLSQYAHPGELSVHGPGHAGQGNNEGAKCIKEMLRLLFSNLRMQLTFDDA